MQGRTISIKLHSEFQNPVGGSLVSACLNFIPLLLSSLAFKISIFDMRLGGGQEQGLEA